MALSKDGRTVAVGATGAYDNDDRPGYVKLYYKQFDVTGWNWKLAKTFTGDAIADRFGLSVSMSEDGKMLAIGAPGYNAKSDRPGYVRVFTRGDDDTWTQLGEDIMGEANGNESGISVSLSSDGKTIAIGAPLNNGIDGVMSGHARVYTVVEGDSGAGSVWKQVGQDIDGEAEYDLSGWSVSLSANGKTVAIGTPFNDEGGGLDAGHLRLYNLVDDVWKQIGHDINGENEEDRFGYSVSLSADGRTVAVGAPWNAEKSGKVKVYVLDSSDSDDKWVQIGQDIIGDETGDEAGISVSLSADGKALTIGANLNDGNGNASGHVRVYRLVDSADYLSWIQVGKDIFGANAEDLAGSSVSLSSDGNVVAVGSPYNDDNGDSSGHVRVFNMDE